jgi:hypothetical protein
MVGEICKEPRIYLRILCDWRSCLLSKLVLVLGVGYLFVPIDLIPDRLPYIGHLDEISFLVLGFVGSRGLVPPELVASWYPDETADGPSVGQCIQFLVRILRADLANFFLFHYRGVDGFLITAKNSGTHWLKFMLSVAIAEEFAVEPPSMSSGREADRIIAHPKWGRPPRIPWIGSSHTIPSIAFAWPWVTSLLPHPPVVVLVRDIEAAMRSNYVKWRAHYGVSIEEYVRGDPSGRRYIADVWWFMHFFGRWGDVANARPGDILIVRYEDLQRAPDSCLRRIAAHYGIRLGDRSITAALHFVDRGAIRAKLDPAEAEIVVPPHGAGHTVHFSHDDRAFMRAAMRRHLRCDFGYGYRWPIVSGSAVELTARPAEAGAVPRPRA